MKRNYQVEKQIHLSSDLLYQIMLNLDFISIIKLCQTNKDYIKICDNNYFWQQKYIHDGYHIQFLEDQNIDRDLYQLAYDIITNGENVYNKIKNKDVYDIYIYLPILSDDTWIINDYIDVQNAYTAIIKLTYYYKVNLFSTSGYFYRQTVIYQTYDKKIHIKEKNINHNQFIELIGFFISHHYKSNGHTKTSITYKSDDHKVKYDMDVSYELRQRL